MTEDADEGRVYGRPGRGRVLVAIAVDALGQPCEWLWADPAAADQWRAQTWHRF